MPPHANPQQPSSAVSVQQVQAIANALSEELSDKDTALRHQRRANRFLGLRVQELEAELVRVGSQRLLQTQQQLQQAMIAAAGRGGGGGGSGAGDVGGPAVTGVGGVGDPAAAAAAAGVVPSLLALSPSSTSQSLSSSSSSHPPASPAAPFSSPSIDAQGDGRPEFLSPAPASAAAAARLESKSDGHGADGLRLLSTASASSATAMPLGESLAWKQDDPGRFPAAGDNENVNHQPPHEQLQDTHDPDEVRIETRLRFEDIGDADDAL